jgi:uncharacterized protein with PIN domain
MTNATPIIIDDNVSYHINVSTKYQLQQSNQGNSLHFLCESSLGKVAKHLRLLGIDCECNTTYNRHYALFKARNEKRIVLTESSSFLKQILRANNPKKKKQSYEVYSDDDSDVEEELVDDRIEYFYITCHNDFETNVKLVTDFFKLMFKPDCIFTRCLTCNTLVNRIELTDENRDSLLKESGVTDCVLKNYGHTLTRCPSCSQLFWQGHYYAHALELAQELSYHPNNNASTVNQNSDKQ